MSTKKLVFIFFVLSLGGLGIGLIAKNSTELGICLVSEPTCINNFTRIGDTLFYGMSALAVVFLILLFTPSAFNVWKKFAIWFVPLATLLFIFYPEPHSGDFLSPYPEQVFRWVSILYVVVSAGIIAWHYFKSPDKV